MVKFSPLEIEVMVYHLASLVSTFATAMSVSALPDSYGMVAGRGIDDAHVVGIPRLASEVT